MSRRLTYFGKNGEYIPNLNDLKRTDESVLPTSQIIGWSKLSRNKIVNNDDNKRFAHKWEKRIQQLIPSKL